MTKSIIEKTIKYWGILCLCVFISSVHAEYFDKKELVVEDPYFGDVLYEFYNGSHFDAIVKLQVAQDLDKVPHHKRDVDIWLGSMYLSYGMHVEAEKVFRRLTKQGISPEIQDRAWYQIAKVRYQKGLFEDAIRALEEIQKDIPDELMGATQLQRANVLMARGEYQQAVQMLSKFPERGQFSQYVKYNMGVALYQSRREVEGTDYLDAVGRLESNLPELKALRDKANMALGFALLANDSYSKARAFFQRVRLSGPFTNKALLGLGWSEAFQQEYQAALVPWTRLAAKERSDGAVYEALLAVPYAYERLQAYRQSFDAYQSAIAIFEEDTQKLDNAIKVVKTGALWKKLLSNITEYENKISWELSDLPNNVEARFLYNLVATNSFQQSIDSLKHLQYLKSTLRNRSSDLETFRYILKSRKENYESRLPQLAPEKNNHRVAVLRDERNFYKEELDRIESEGDLRALATPAERISIGRLDKIQDFLRRNKSIMPKDQYNQMADKFRLYSGLLEWSIGTNIKPRLWKFKRALRDLDTELNKTITQQKTVKRAKVMAPRQFDGYSKKIDKYKRRVTRLDKRVDTLIVAQKAQLQQQVINELNWLKQRLRGYLDQAHFAVAHLQDLGSNQ
ncbi:MAG: tetratricopeptide repeat protein [Gammaproteobacteria bacterium]|nr:tetratricopeptide repeat protein [Gammaproteobacteria bacterium]MDH5802069.1 tetratricopeptide repeat protein [Gammaproteobacteria bacterium]